MAYLNNEEYERRNEAAARRMAKNAEISTMTEDQHTAIALLCKLRHELHSNKDSVITSADNDVKNNLIKCNIQIEQAGITPMPFVPTSTEDFIDIDTMYEVLNTDINDVPDRDEDEDAWQNYYDSNYERISGEIEELNDKIEQYLQAIDAQYGTNYAPTGSLRNF